MAAVTKTRIKESLRSEGFILTLGRRLLTVGN